MEDLDLLAGLTPRIGLRTLCPLGDAACGPMDSALQKFRHEFEHHITHKTCYAKGSRLLSQGRRALVLAILQVQKRAPMAPVSGAGIMPP